MLGLYSLVFLSLFFLLWAVFLIINVFVWKLSIFVPEFTNFRACLSKTSLIKMNSILLNNGFWKTLTTVFTESYSEYRSCIVLSHHLAIMTIVSVTLVQNILL